MQRLVTRGRVLAAVVLAAVLAGAYLAGSQDDPCSGGTFDASCAGQRVPAPDPGGDERAEAPVPPRNKAFGFNLGVWASGDDSPERGVRALQRLGATHYRFALQWNLARQPSSPDDPIPADWKAPLGRAAGEQVRRWDAVYQAVVAAKLVPIVILGDVPRWAGTLNECLGDARSDARRCPPYWAQGSHLPDAGHLDAWKQWVEVIARRYPKAILEGPNEPDLQWRKRKEQPAAAPWAAEPEVTAAAQCALKDVAGDERFVLSPAMSDPEYVRGYLERAADCHNGFSLHVYPTGPKLGADTPFARTFAGLRDARLATGDGSPIWVTETGWSFIPRPGAAGRAQETEAAAVLRRVYDRLATMDDVAGVLFHTLRDAPIDFVSNPATTEYHFGFFKADWNPKKRACSFFQPGTPQFGPCPRVPKGS